MTEWVEFNILFFSHPSSFPYYLHWHLPISKFALSADSEYNNTL